MVRPCYLVVDVEHGGSISTRKLVIETAKLNVITAYSNTEAIETLAKFPALDGAIIDTAARDIPCVDLLRELKRLRPDMPVIVVGRHACEGADHYLDSFEPARLLTLLQKLKPAQFNAIAERDAKLTDSGE